MKEHPILFSGDMVRAILDGRKTQARRVVRNPPYQWDGAIRVLPSPSGLFIWDDGKPARPSPYGIPGEALWVRETWAYLNATGGPARPQDHPKTYVYRANPSLSAPLTKWKPSIHMPRKASRLLLEVVEVKVERLQEITYPDVRDEGVGITMRGANLLLDISSKYAPAKYLPEGFLAEPIDRGKAEILFCAHFASLWDSINAKRGHPWESNPWVWAVTFRRIEE